MFIPLIKGFAIGFGLPEICRLGLLIGRGVTDVPFGVVLGIEGLCVNGAPFNAAVAPSSATAAPVNEKAGPYPDTSTGDELSVRCDGPPLDSSPFPE